MLLKVNQAKAIFGSCNDDLKKGNVNQVAIVCTSYDVIQNQNQN